MILGDTLNVQSTFLQGLGVGALLALVLLIINLAKCKEQESSPEDLT